MIRRYSECELDYGTLKTLKMIDDTSDDLIKNSISKHTEKCSNCKLLFKPEDIDLHKGYCK